MRKQLIRTPGVLFYRHNGFEGVALLYDAHNFTRTTDLGPMNCRFPGCQCMKFVEETPAFCCGNGKHRIVNHPPHPDYLQRLFDGATPTLHTSLPTSGSTTVHFRWQVSPGTIIILVVKHTAALHSFATKTTHNNAVYGEQ